MSGHTGQPIRALHLFSNCKWTGPAEPALNLCIALREAGVEADFACAPDAGRSVNRVVESARDRGLEPLLDFHLKKHRHPLYNWLDRRTLRRVIQRKQYDLVHCHLNNDHAIAVGALGGSRLPIVRSSYEGEGFPAGQRYHQMLARTALVLEPSQGVLETDRARFSLEPSALRVVPGAVDTARFDPAREVPDGRRWRQIPRDAFVVGIVARMQRHRRYEDLFEALGRLVAAYPNTHLVVIGRGTHQERVAFEPVQRLGLAQHVHFTGYIDGENYVGMLRAFDAGIYLVPGSDGTCRATREMMAMGKPVVVADRGMLAEIVTHEVDGLVFDGSSGRLFEALARLAGDPPYCRALGRAAAARARSTYSMGAQAQLVRACYGELLSPAAPG